MKVILVSNTDWYLFRFRISLASYLRSRNIEVVMVCPNGQYVQAIEEQGFRWVKWEVGRKTVNPLTELSSLLHLIRILKQEKPDLIHLHTIKPVIYGTLAAQIVNFKKIVRSVTGRGYIFIATDWRAKILRPLVKGIYRFILRNSYGVTIFENSNDKQFFEENKLINKEKSFLIEGVGVDINYFSAQLELDQSPIILMASRLLWDKGVDTFVEAAHITKQNYEKVRFVLVGQPDTGNPASIPVSIINNWVNNKIIEWWGWKADMREVFATCHIVALPSLSEGIPTVLLEAAACARPLVATDVPGCREVVQNGVNGFLVPVKDAQALSLAFQKLIINKELRSTMGRASRQIVETRFASDKINQQTFELYVRLQNST